MQLNNEPYTAHPLPYYLVEHTSKYPDALNYQVIFSQNLAVEVEDTLR